jgi:regulator of RNase E activity RraA
MTSKIPHPSTVADVLALRGSGGCLTPPLAPVVASTEPRCGQAVTIELDAVSSGADFTPMYRLVSSDLRGKVVVIGGANRIDGCIWGGILATAAHQAGAVAVLVDGSVRDVNDLKRVATPVYASNRGVGGPNGRATVRSIGGPVDIGGILIREGDSIVFDADGCVTISASTKDRILADSARYAAAEDQVVEALAAGEPLSTAYRYKSAVVSVLRGETTTESNQSHGRYGPLGSDRSGVDCQ